MRKEQEHGNGASQIEQSTLESPTAFSARDLLLKCIGEDTGQLLGIIRSYVLRFHLAIGDQVAPVALEVLQEVVIEALEHVDRFTSTRQPRAWLLGIAVNVIQRKRVEEAKRIRREWQLVRLSHQHSEALNEQELLDQLIQTPTQNLEQEYITKEQVAVILSLVTEEDREILRLALLEEFKREALALHLGTTPGTVRMRLHRALGRLRLAWKQYQEIGVANE